MPADEFGGGMNYYIRAVFYGAYQIRRGKSIVYSQRYLMRMGNTRQFFNVYHVGVGITQSLDK